MSRLMVDSPKALGRAKSAGHERERVAHRLARAPRARQQRRAPAAVGQDLDRRGPHADEQLAGVPSGPGHVLAAVDRHVAALVGARPHPPDRVEGVRRQRGHRREVLGEHLRDRAPVSAPRRGVESRAAGLEHPVELLERADRWHRDEQVSPDEADGVLHGALLVAGVRVAVAARAPVVGPEQGEQVNHPRFR